MAGQKREAVFAPDVPVINALLRRATKDVNARDKPGHDEAIRQMTMHP
jgi:hypothetical protein